MIELNKFKTLEQFEADISSEEDEVVNVTQLFLVCDIINNDEFNELIKLACRESGFATWEGFFVDSKKIKKIIKMLIEKRPARQPRKQKENIWK